jgi:hypothetical protein
MEALNTIPKGGRYVDYWIIGLLFRSSPSGNPGTKSNADRGHCRLDGYFTTENAHSALKHGILTSLPLDVRQIHSPSEGLRMLENLRASFK